MYKNIAAVLYISLCLFGAGFTAQIGQKQNLKGTYNPDFKLSPSFVYYKQDPINQLLLEIQQQSSEEQLNSLKSFIHNGHLFFTADQIILIIRSLKEPLSINYAINIMMPYISPLSTNEAIQIIQVLQNQTQPTITIISQIYDLNGGNEFQVMNALNYAMYYKTLFLDQQMGLMLSSFKLTQQGKHVAFLFDKTSSMNQIAFTKNNGDTLTRYQLLAQFFASRQDITQNFNILTYCVLNKYENTTQRMLFTQAIETNRSLNAYIYNSQVAEGHIDLYQSLSSLLSESEDYMSDLYILTDGITQGENSVEAFIQLIQNNNSKRQIKVRINAISFLLGGTEIQEQRQLSDSILQALSDYSNGTFMRYVPLKD